MFKENNTHLQQSMLTSTQWMNPSIVKRLMRSWAAVFYSMVFCRIKETIFAKFYCADNGRPNFPVNILLALEYIKNLFDYSDVELIEQFYFNYQIAYAVGIKNVGEVNLSPGTLYEFRRKIYRYAIENPEKEDLIFEQFIELTKDFAKQSDVAVNEQRMDSTMISANIKDAGRLALAYDVIEQALRALPKELLTEPMKKILEEGYRNRLLYKSKGSQIISRIQEILDLCVKVMALIANDCEMIDLPAMKVLKRFIEEQTNYDNSTDKYNVKANKEIKASSLQSAYDEDATYRKKAGKYSKGYTVNIAETCNEKNEVQFITDYDAKPNVSSDQDYAKERLPKIKENFEVTDMYVDGGYSSYEVDMVSEKEKIEMHYTDLSGKKPDVEIIPASKFELNEDNTVKQCPKGIEPTDTNYNPESGKINAHFSKELCNACELRDKCCIKEQVKANKFSTSDASIESQNRMDKVRENRKENTGKRAAIEGTNSELKRAHGLDDVKVRGVVKIIITTGLKITACNFKRFSKNMIKKLAKPIKSPDTGKSKGIAIQF